MICSPADLRWDKPWRPVNPGSTTVSLRFVPAEPPIHPGTNRGATGMNCGSTGMNWGATGTNLYDTGMNHSNTGINRHEPWRNIVVTPQNKNGENRHVSSDSMGRNEPGYAGANRGQNRECVTGA